ncbi:hypothetical protein CWB96_09635 [Pseudoalteromonas citrea]|uniref:histidine kinase n=1 Tax=Pseudoalteromonas citrea TaxID=43655 RepID=A0A5S3XPS6_9GAMM|nr:ATP-binding protein [Pseudoalteromonas citrea]TMP38843.1 hypothetical protein CWB97_21360 [Pseudoalteromonas citrea]TMP59371.1 hypothetical protein CWB96_09635 [Pseudoalteromonas citrea]
MTALIALDTQSIKNSISMKLLSSVLSIYFLLTLIVTGVHIAVEYQDAKNEVQSVLEASEQTFHDILATDLWNYDLDQLNITAESIKRLPDITGIEVKGAEGTVLFSSGKTLDKTIQQDGLFWHQFTLVKTMNDENTDLGVVRLYSDRSVIINSIKSGVYTLAINAVIKTLALVVLVTIIFRKLLTLPLGLLARHADSIDPDNAVFNRIDIAKNTDDELGLVQNALNGMMEKTADTIKKLDTVNRELEQRVVERTEKLNRTVNQLDIERATLKEEVATRQQSEAALEQSLEDLKRAQGQLIESEKLASLGGLVAGVAHEINTPVGLSLTGISHFEHMVEDIDKLFQAGELEEDDFSRFTKDSRELAKTIHVSLARAANLVKSFKQVAVDQSSEEIREFDILEYLEETMTSMNSQLKQSNVNFEVVCNEQILMMTSYPGSWAQIFTNLIQNTLIHAYDKDQTGQVTLTFAKRADSLVLEFKDDGKGMSTQTIEKIFDPFFTTNRANGGSGLGMNIIYNIVTQKLSGTITVESEVGQGSSFYITAPIKLANV